MARQAGHQAHHEADRWPTDPRSCIEFTAWTVVDEIATRIADLRPVAGTAAGTAQADDSGASSADTTLPGGKAFSQPNRLRPS